jgi:hypothetical protein
MWKGFTFSFNRISFPQISPQSGTQLALPYLLHNPFNQRWLITIETEVHSQYDE